jgi:hypothetical protein
MVGEEITKGLAKFSKNSKYHPTTFATAHPTASSSLSTPCTSATPPPYGMPLNYFSEQTPPAHNTSMSLYMPEPIPISTISPTSAISGQANFIPLLLVRLTSYHHWHPWVPVAMPPPEFDTPHHMRHNEPHRLFK